MKFSIQSLLATMTISAMACGLYVQQLRIDSLKELMFPDGGYRWVPDSGMKATLDLSLPEFAELYPEEWQFLKKAKLGPFTDGVERELSVYGAGVAAIRREEQDDPEGSWAKVKVGDRIELSDPAVTWTGVVDAVTDNGITVGWFDCRDIFCTDEKHPYPDPFISKSMGIGLIESGWIDLLDY